MAVPMRRTKILATVGPASDSPAGLAGLLAAGADGLRLNFSHGTTDAHRTVLRNARSAARKLGREIALVADLQGPKIRIGEVDGGSTRLVEGSTWVFERSGAVGKDGRLPMALPGARILTRRGDPILLGDGSVELAVTQVAQGRITARVVHGGTVTSHAGLYFPNARLRPTLLGPKDRADLQVALEEGVDFVALSFVRSDRDVQRTRRLLDHLGAPDVGLIAKIERAEALARIDQIADAADGLMVARGDLGIEVPLDRLALEQKRLVSAANARGKPVIVATQMLLSMLRAPRPTRAEATDVANAVLDGADALMLSEESAVGPYAPEAVTWLDRIARTTESAAIGGQVEIHSPPAFRRDGSEWAVASAAVHLAREVGAGAIVTPTHSGRTARLVAARRPACPIVALSSVPQTRRRLSLVWGVVARPSPQHLSLSGLRDLARLEGRRIHAERGQPSVLTAGFPVEGRPTNLVTVIEPG